MYCAEYTLLNVMNTNRMMIDIVVRMRNSFLSSSNVVLHHLYSIHSAEIMSRMYSALSNMWAHISGMSPTMVFDP